MFGSLALREVSSSKLDIKHDVENKMLKFSENSRINDLNTIKRCVFQYSLVAAETHISIRGHWIEIFCVAFKRKLTV